MYFRDFFLHEMITYTKDQFCNASWFTLKNPVDQTLCLSFLVYASLLQALGS